MKTRFLLPLLMICPLVANSQEHLKSEGGATQTTPSYSEYFSWINNTNEGATDGQTRINLDFFKWLYDEYGMVLDIYAFDAGAIDGALIYGNTDSERFKSKFPEGFGPLSKKAGEMGTRLGIWCGPDGFGDTPEEAKKREEMMVGLVRDYNFGLFKMDAVCGQLRKEKYGEFDRMMTRVREYNPNFILLNHRLKLGPGTRHTTTYLLGGEETYIDVLMTNTTTATHHRAGAMSRKAPENLTRLTEDHGVCLSSYLDYWEDDLILQAFGRELLLAPEIYGNPWLLKDEDFPQLAYIFNLHRRYRDILPAALRLDEKKYGPEALSRGNGKTQFVTLRNLTWEPVKYRISLNQETGLTPTGKKVQVRLCHPYIYDMGKYVYGKEIEVEVLPFRSALVKLTTEAERDPILVSGIPYQIIKDNGKGNNQIKLLGNPGETYRYRIGKGREQKITFPGTPLKEKFHRQLTEMKRVEVPADAKALYYATCYAADNNALELRELKRSGETEIPQVKAARDAFFNQQRFRERDVNERNLFDDDLFTGFAIMKRWGELRPNAHSEFLIDFGEEINIDKLQLNFQNEFEMSPLKVAEGQLIDVSTNLRDWKTVSVRTYYKTEIPLKNMGAVRYVKMHNAPLRVTEISGFCDGKKLDRSKWHVCNLFDKFRNMEQAWTSSLTLTEAARGSYLCIAIEGNYGKDKVWAAVKMGDHYIGCPDRAPGYISNTWEFFVHENGQNYTYFIPVTEDMIGKPLEAWVLGLTQTEMRPKVWITAYPIPFEQKVVDVK